MRDTTKAIDTLHTTTNYEKQLMMNNHVGCDAGKGGKQQKSNDLQSLLEEVEKWNVDNNPEDLINLQRHFKFTDIDKKRAKTIDVSLTDYGALDLNNLQNEIESCKDEYIKVRIPSDVDISDVTLRDSFGKRNSEKERPKTMAEYFC